MTKQTGKKKTTRQQYPREFKIETLALAEKVSVPTAAKELGLHESQLYGWRMKARAAQDRSEMEQKQAIEIVRLKRQLAEQAEELSIVKKAATYFAKSSPRPGSSIGVSWMILSNRLSLATKAVRGRPGWCWTWLKLVTLMTARLWPVACAVRVYAPRLPGSSRQPRTPGTTYRWPPICYSKTSAPWHSTRSSWAISRISGRRKAGCTLQLLSTCTRAWWWDGRCQSA